jgi:hypothetical protein
LGIPPYGCLAIDPATFVTSLMGVSAPVVGGSASFIFAIPNDPALVGASVYSQAGLFTATFFSFTNGLQTTILPC